MAITPVDVANIALQHIGANNAIEALDEGSFNANAVSLVYDNTLDSVLREYDWGFAKTIITPARLDIVSPTERWLYVYDYPADALKVLQIQRIDLNELKARNERYARLQYPDPVGGEGANYGGSEPYYDNIDADVDYDVIVLKNGNTSRKVLVSNTDCIELVYTKREDDPNLWDSQFLDMMTYRLAARLAVPIASSTELMGRMTSTANAMLMSAGQTSATESVAVRQGDADWITGRD